VLQFAYAIALFSSCQDAGFCFLKSAQRFKPARSISRLGKQAKMALKNEQRQSKKKARNRIALKPDGNHLNFAPVFTKVSREAALGDVKIDPVGCAKKRLHDGCTSQTPLGVRCLWEHIHPRFEKLLTEFVKSA